MLGCREALVPLFALQKDSDMHKQPLNWPLLVFPSNLIYHSLLVSLPLPCLSVVDHQWPDFGFITSQQVRQMTIINYKEPLLWCHLSLTPKVYFIQS